MQEVTDALDIGERKRVVLSWSSGKDSAWALHLLRQMPHVRVVALLTTFNESADRVAMHAVRSKLAEAQAERAGLPLWRVDLPWPCANDVYERLMSEVCQRALQEAVTHFAFGDLFLQDVRQYRERQLKGTGIEPLFPLWNIPTGKLARHMLAGGVRAKVTCVDPKKLHCSFAGRDFDARFLADLPEGVDPCGENGEFHTFVYDAPVFASAIPVETGVVLERDGFVFADVLPKSGMKVDAGLCATCAHQKIVTSDKGSEFSRCVLADKNLSYAKYPRLPVVRCAGFLTTGE